MSSPYNLVDGQITGHQYKDELNSNSTRCGLKIESQLLTATVFDWDDTCNVCWPEFTSE